ncbi:MAG: ABC transporter permease [Anaerolineales bacterium]|nr:ABC transporter permease [Anaerolineales bacterium]
MGRYVIRRILQFIPTLAIVSVLVFAMTDLAPGDAVLIMAGTEASDEALDMMRESLGLDRPFLVRLGEWFVNALQGDLGVSFYTRQPVFEVLAKRIPVTLNISALALLVALIVGIGAGMVAAAHQGRVADWLAMMAALFVISAPYFWLALNFIFLFSVKLKWFPVGNYVAFKESPQEFVKHLILPCTALGLSYAGMIARMTRTSMLEVLRADYVRTAHAKGLKLRIVTVRHIFRNALIPLTTVLGVTVGALVGGSVITETVFGIAGVGRLVVDGVVRRDIPVVQGGLLVVTFGYLLSTLIVDVLYVWFDPRIRYD